MICDKKQKSSSVSIVIMAIAERRTAEETRSCILFTAWDLFRQLGARTTVADIAQKLGMSSANVYRFYPSKQALSEAVCETLLAEVLKAARRELEATGPASKRIAAMMLTVHRFMRDQMIDQARAHEIVEAAVDQSWPPVVDYVRKCVAMLAETIADGQAAGEFGPGDPERLGWQTIEACVTIHDPALIVKCGAMRPDHRPEDTVEFALRALMNRAPPAPPLVEA
jgi:AcrR family transcriptional regulator